MIPETWVPCPFKSPSDSLTKLAPLMALPSNSGCLISIPVSITYATISFPVVSYLYLNGVFNSYNPLRDDNLAKCLGAFF